MIVVKRQTVLAEARTGRDRSIARVRVGAEAASTTSTTTTVPADSTSDSRVLSGVLISFVAVGLVVALLVV